jgi:hypothetical protein
MSTLVDIGVGLGAAGLAADLFALSDDYDTRRAGRIGGLVLLSTFALSAVYRAYVTVECQSSSPGSLRRAEQAERFRPRKVAGFAGEVLQFQFGAPTDVAARAWVAAGGGFEPGYAYSLCLSPARSLARPDVRLEFHSGPLSRVTLVYPTTPDSLQATLAHIEAQAQSYYGHPRSGPTAWPASCVSSGAVQCLKEGELPGHAFWSFTDGDIELRPSLDGDMPLVELRYTRYDPPR